MGSRLRRGREGQRWHLHKCNKDKCSLETANQSEGFGGDDLEDPFEFCGAVFNCRNKIGHLGENGKEGLQSVCSEC